MMVSTRSSVFRLLFWQWKNVLYFTIAAATSYFAILFLKFETKGIPTLPLAVVGAALGIFVSFRTNSAYDRWWEGRKLWGRLINTSRHFATQINTYLHGDDATAERKRIIERHIAYVDCLRCILRVDAPGLDSDVTRVLAPDDRVALEKSNPTHFLLELQTRDIEAAAQRGDLDLFRLQRIDNSIEKLLDIQGGCERIKKTPLPRGYAFIAVTLVKAYAFLFPFALIEPFQWGAIPLTVMVCLSFALINETGRVLEDPFTKFWNGLPLTQISRMIEANLRDLIGEEAPPVPGIDENGVLM